MSIRDMVARKSKASETDDFVPTPPYATRTVLEECFPVPAEDLWHMPAWDPAYGEGHMGRPLSEYFHWVYGSDVTAYNHWHAPEQWLGLHDFVKDPVLEEMLLLPDLCIITNPPYKYINKFVARALEYRPRFLAILGRIQFLEGEKRYYNIFNTPNRPSSAWVVSDRITFKSGKVVRSAPKMFTHCWFIWDREDAGGDTKIKWIAPKSDARWAKDEDYV